MATYRPAPGRRSGGPDGRGWNRLAAEADLCGDECTLRPRSYTTLWVSRYRPAHAEYGSYGPCARGGECGGCPIFTAAPIRLRRMNRYEPRILVRVLGGGGHPDRPHLMSRPDRADDPFEQISFPTTWEELRRVEGWKLDGHHGRDEYGEYFWLIDVRGEAPE